MKMKPKMWFVLLVDVLLLGFLFFASSTDWLFTEQKQTSYKVSILMEETGATTEYFTAGIQEAAIAKNVDVHILTFTQEQTMVEKTELLQKQLEKGVQGLVLCLEDDEQTEELLSSIPTSVPVVSWGQDLHTESVYTNVGYDIVAEVNLLLEMWSTNERKREVAYVTLEDENQEDLQYYENLCYMAEAGGFQVELLELAELSGAKTLIQGMAIEGKRILVTRDMELLAALGDAALDLQLKIPVYGIGYEDGARSPLEQGAIHGVVVHREYEGGYIALCQVVNALQQKSAPKESIVVESAMITADNMYGTEEETFIFPYK